MEKKINSRFKHPYKPENYWKQINPILLDGEIVYSSDKDGYYKIGDGTKTWSELSYITIPPAYHTHNNETIVGIDGSKITSGVISKDRLPNFTWNEITNKPTVFPPSSHNHEISQINNLQNTLNGKANSVHEHWRLKNLTDITIPYCVGLSKEGLYFRSYNADGDVVVNNAVSLGSPNGMWKTLYTGRIESSDYLNIYFQKSSYWYRENIEHFGMLNDGKGLIRSLVTYDRTYSSGSQVCITSSGTFGRITSASKYKLNIKPLEQDKSYPYRILDIEPKQWFDKSSTETYAELLTKKQNGEITDGEIDKVDFMPMESVYGLIAEDVEKAGLEKYCYYKYNKDGSKELEGIAYDRLCTLLIPIVKDLVNENKEIKAKFQNLEERLKKLEQK